MPRRVVLDANFLVALTDNIPEQNDHPLVRIPGLRDKLKYLFECFDAEGDEVVIPTPSLAEALCLSQHDAEQIIAKLDAHFCIRIAPFDRRAATEYAMLFRNKDKQGGFEEENKRKIKFDLQILSIALVERATVIFTNDDGLAKRCLAARLSSVRYADLKERPADPQPQLQFGPIVLPSPAPGPEDLPEAALSAPGLGGDLVGSEKGAGPTPLNGSAPPSPSPPPPPPPPPPPVDAGQAALQVNSPPAPASDTSVADDLSGRP